MIPNFPPPPPLPGPPTIQWLLLESGWPWAAVGLCVLAWILWMTVPRDAKARAWRWAPAGLVLAGLGVTVLAHLVETDHEAVLRRTAGMVAAAAGGDRAGMDRDFAPSIRIESSLVRTRSGKGPLIDEIAATVAAYQVTDWAVVENQAQVTGDRARSQFLVRAESGNGALHFSWWSAAWQREGGEWRVTTIKPIAVQGVSGLE